MAVPGSTILDIPQREQDAMLAALRRSRYGFLLGLHILLLCASGKTPTEIADSLFCSRSSVYRIVAAYRAGTLGFEIDEDGAVRPPIRTRVLLPWLKRSILALLTKPPRAFGWCRTRWSCATLAAQLKLSRGIEVSAETMRRYLHELDYVWKRAKLVARDDDPRRIERLAAIRFAFENLGKRAAMVFADELDIDLLPKVGAQWTPRGHQEEIATPGTNEKRYLAGALDVLTGAVTHCIWYRKRAGLFLSLLEALDDAYPRARFNRIVVVVDNAKIHSAAIVREWLVEHPRFEVLFLPTYCPKANPIERCFGDVHDKCTRNHQRKRLRDLVADVVRHVEVNGPWVYKLSSLYYEPEITAAVKKHAAEKFRKIA